MTFEKVKELLIAVFKFEDADLIIPQASLSKDLSLDSLDYLDLCMAIEDAFGVDLLTEKEDACRTVADIVECINEALA